MKIVYDNLVDPSSVTVTGSTTALGSPTDVQILQPSEFFRTSVVNDGYVDIDFNAVRGFDVIALLNSNATRHRNLLRQSNTLDTSPWTKTNINAVTEGDTSEGPVGTVGTSNAVYDNGTSGEHKLTQAGIAGVASGGFTHTPITLGAYLGFESGQLDEARLHFEANSDYVYCDFDLAAGTAGTPQTVDMSNASASITAVSSISTTNIDWYWCQVTATPDSALFSDISAVLYLMDGNGAISYSGSTNLLWVCGMQMELGSTIDRDELAVTTTDAAALVRVTESTGDVAGAEWQHVSPRNLTGRGRTDWFVVLDSPHYGANPRVEVSDEFNLDGYLNFGRIVIGQAVSIDDNLTNYVPDVTEIGGEGRARGGQHYRGIHSRTRIADFDFEYLTRAQAMGEMMQIYRALGRSTPGFFVADEYEATYPDEFAIYGFISGDHPVVRQMGLFWRTSMLVEEVL